jgi:hypothetical protein
VETLAKVVAKAAKKIDRRYCYGLPHHALDAKLKLGLVEIGDLALFDTHAVAPEVREGWLPFATLHGEPEFLVISQHAPHAIGMWEKDSSKVLVGWDSLADFLARVIDKKDKTPYVKLEKTLEKISTLVDADKYADALGLLEPIMKSLPKLPAVDSWFEDDDMARAYNLFGLSLKGVKMLPEARRAFEGAAHLGDKYAMLNILDMLEDAHDSKQVIEYGLASREGYLDDYCRIWLARYLAIAYATIGEPEKGAVALRETIADFGVSAADKLLEARASIEEYVAKPHPNVDAVRPYLEWYKPKSYDVSPAEAKANRAWWQSAPEGMRAELMKEIDKEGKDPTDEDIARCLDVESLHLDEDDGTFDKLDMFLRLARVERLAFYGDPDDVGPLRALPKLQRLTVNNDVIKNFEFPSRADRDLWKAAEAADRKGIEKALAAGASLTRRGNHGRTALAMAAGSHDVELCEWLVLQGSDPWAGSHGESTPLDAFATDDAKRLEAAAKQAGIPHPDDDPWRVLELSRMPSHATFETELELELEDGESLATTWPTVAKLKMGSPKKDKKLYDLHNVKYRGFVASQRLAELLRGPNVEVLPVTLVDHAGKDRPEPYFLINPLAIDCLVLERCYPKWNHINPESISGLPAYVVDPAKVGAAQMFRLARANSHPALISRELATQIATLEGVRIEYARR